MLFHGRVLLIFKMNILNLSFKLDVLNVWLDGFLKIN